MTLEVPKITGPLNFILAINSNDPTMPVVNVEYKFKVNSTPTSQVIPTQNLTNLSVTHGLSQFFSDADGDPLAYSIVSTDATVAAVSISNSEMTISPLSTGTADVSVTATDPFSASVTTTFKVNVQKNAAVTGLEPDPTLLTFTSSPNPFERDFVIRYNTAHPLASEVVVIDVSGRIVLRTGLVEEKYGENMVVMNGAGLASGIYQCIVTRNGERVWRVRMVRR
jgi:hypothetical protein